jgi:MFS transporter, DHA2 family, multidrug resistance protein
MMHNLGGAIGTAVLATIVTKREQFHSNIIGQSVDLGREDVRTRIAELTNYFIAHGVPEPITVHTGNACKIGASIEEIAEALGGGRGERERRRGHRLLDARARCLSGFGRAGRSCKKC